MKELVGMKQKGSMKRIFNIVPVAAMAVVLLVSMFVGQIFGVFSVTNDLKVSESGRPV